MTYFLDTNICIFHLNGTAPRLSNVLEHTAQSSIAIPSIVAAELIYGAEKSAKREHNLEKTGLFLSLYDIIPFDLDAAKIYGAIRRDLEYSGQIIGGNDLIIAATVLARKGTLVTNNTGEFSRVRGLLLEDWV
jgi:tRNA(fMet)-specific endonuclease VapC